MSLELFLDSKIIMSCTFLATQRDETTWTFNDFGRDRMAKTKTEQKRRRRRAYYPFIYEKLQLRSISFH